MCVAVFVLASGFDSRVFDNSRHTAAGSAASSLLATSPTSAADQTAEEQLTQLDGYIANSQANLAHVAADMEAPRK